MSETKTFFLDNYQWIIGTAIATIALAVGIWRVFIMKRKDKIDTSDFINKKTNFAVSIHDGYRLIDKNEKFKLLLFNIMVSNKATTKITVIPKINIYYKTGKINKAILTHNRELFIKEIHSNIDKFDNSISIDEKGIKSGWIIADIPKEILGKRIDRVEILLQDSLGNNSISEYYLLKNLYYETKAN